MRRRLLTLLVIAALLGAPPLCSAQHAEAESTQPDAKASGIAFLHLKLGVNAAELAGFEITPGRLKPAVQRAGERILLRVESAAGALLWEGTISDPRTQVFESSDAEGRPVRKVIDHPESELMARVPFFEHGQVVRVSRATPAEAGAANEKLLGTFKLSR